MKKTICLLATIALLASMSYAWFEPGYDPSNPITQGYYSTLYSSSILPLVANTGAIGSTANAWNFIHGDTLYSTTDATLKDYVMTNTISNRPGWTLSDSTSGQARSSISLYNSGGTLITTGNFNFAGYLASSNNTYIYTSAAKSLLLYSGLAKKQIWLGTSDSTVAQGWAVDSLGIRGKATGSTITSDTAKHNDILPITANTGSIGSATNAFNRIHSDSLFCAESLAVWKLGTETKARIDTFYNAEKGAVRTRDMFWDANGPKATYFTATTGFICSSDYGLNGSTYWYNRTSALADSARFKYLATAKDTCLEIATFTRTCTRDTLAFMTGADSLTSGYAVEPFATRGAVTVKPYIAGIVGGKLIIDRPAADTASYDRYSVFKVSQR